MHILSLDDQTFAWLVTAVLAPMPALAVPVLAEDDTVLVRQAQQNLNAFTDLYERHVQRVYRYLLVRVGNVPDAQDLTSQTFIAAMENLHRYGGERPFPAWLLGIARHKAADFYRRPPEADLETAVYLPDLDESPDDLVNQRLQVEAVARKLKTIAPDRAEALSLRLFGGLEVPEIARIMDKNEAAVRMLMHRGLRDLQAQLAPYWEEQE